MIDTIQQQKSLGLMAVQCLCELLTSHPYFNYSTNIVQLLTVYLDNPDRSFQKSYNGVIEVFFIFIIFLNCIITRDTLNELHFILPGYRSGIQYHFKV